MSVITTGKTFSNGEQLSADKLNLMLTGATFSNSAVDLTSTRVDSSGAIVVKDGGITPSKLSAGAPSWKTDGLVKLKNQDNALDDWWGSSHTPAIFTPHGYLGSNGGYAVSLFCNGYRNTSGGFTSLGVNGNTNASGIDLPPTGTTIFRNGAPTGTTVTESMRIQGDGLVRVGLNTSPNSKIRVDNYANGFGYGIDFYGKAGSDGFVPLNFRSSSGVIVGSVTHTNSSTSFNVSSDYRLKEDIIDISDSLERLKALKPCNFAWKADGSRVDGFIAHEAQEVVPEAVTGTKDAVDDEGNPEYQGIDQSKLVPLLTKALQEALTKIETLEARVEVLENA